jgi:carbamate kinase
VVIALGGNALLKRGEPLTAAAQRDNVRLAAPALAGVALDHELVLSHGNGPQVGLLALQSAAYTAVDPYPLDVLGAQTEGMIGYVLEQELRNVLPGSEEFATIMTMVEVDPEDPAFANPTKFVGPVYTQGQAQALAAEKGWPFRRDGESWRRVVPSPLPRHIYEIDPIRVLLDRDVVVICAGGGGVPTMSTPHPDSPDGRPTLSGVEAVIDKDLASELLAREVEADLFVMATDVDGVYTGWGTPQQKHLAKVTPAELRDLDLPAGSMGPKVEAAAHFVESTGNRAAIGSLEQIQQVVAGSAGTQVVAA